MKEEETDNIVKLKDQIRILTEENQRYTEQTQGIVLLSMISEHLLKMTDRHQIVRYVLEEISVLKGIPFTALGKVENSKVVSLYHQYASFSEKNMGLSQLKLGKSTLASLFKTGNIVQMDLKNVDETDIFFRFQQSDFQPNFMLMVGTKLFDSHDFFLFIDDRSQAETHMRSFVPILLQLNNMVSARFDYLRLMEQLKHQNLWLEQEVNNKTQEIREKLNYQTQIIETSQDGILIHKDYIIQFANPAAVQMIEATDDSQLIGRSIFDFITKDPNEVAIIQSRIQNVIKKKQNIPFRETQVITFKGNIRTVEASGIPFHNEDESLVHLTLRDITEKEQIEQTIEEERSLFIGGPTVIFKWKEGTGWPVDYVSPNILTQFGYHPEDFTSGKMDYDDIIHQEDRQRIEKEIELLKKQGIYNYEQKYRILHADGDYRQVMDFTIYHPSDVGAAYFHGYVIDITSQMLVEQALNESERRYHTMVEYSFEGIGLINNSFTITYANKNLCKIFGYPHEEVVGSVFRKFLSPESIELVTNHYKDRQAGKEVPSRYQFVILQKNGSNRNVEISSSVIKDRMGYPQTIVQLIDITARKKAEAEIQQAHEVLKQNYQSLKAVQSVADAVRLPLDRNTMALRTTEALRKYAGTPSVGFFVLEEGEDQLEFVAAVGFSKTLVSVLQHLPLHKSLAGLAVNKQEVILSSNFLEEDRIKPFAVGSLSKAGYRSTVSIPLIYQNKVLGVIDLLFKKAIELTQSEKDTFFSIGQTLGLALANVNHLNLQEQEIIQRKKIEKELHRYHEELENIVKQRTAELENVNQTLRIKNNELSRYNELFINREFRIKELRNELKTLKKKLIIREDLSEDI